MKKSFILSTLILLTHCSLSAKSADKATEEKNPEIAAIDFAVTSPAQEDTIKIPIIIAVSSPEKYKDWGEPPPDTVEYYNPWSTSCWMVSPNPQDVSASSILLPQGKHSYDPANIADDNPKTAWVEGKGDYGIGEYIEIKDCGFAGDAIFILNGYQSSRQTWENNSRVKKLKISCNGKDILIVELADKMGEQKINYDFDYGTFRFTIVEVYPGLKYKDTAISEIFSCGG